MATEKRMIDANELQQGKFVEPRTEWHQGWNDALDAAMSQAPTVGAVEVVHGHWVDLGRNYYTVVSQCSECGSKYDFRSPYCPNCGAKMDGDGNA